MSTTQGERPAGACPVRKLTRPDDAAAPAIEQKPDGRWVVRSFALARDVLRASDETRQAGFGAERMDAAGERMRPPILYLEGPPHHAQRRAAARFFAPKTTEAYRPMMEALAAELVGTVRSDRWTDVSQLSLRMAVQVAGRVVGLTESSVAGMSRRLESFFHGDPLSRVRSPRGVVRTLRRSTALLRFHHLDVKPAIRARRKERREDVISQLLEQGFSDLDILTECVTYGAAGMVTTREFITVAVWHLTDDPPLMARYLAAERPERLAILEEALRLEPVVGHLHRRTTAPLILDGPGGPVELPAGTLVDLDVRAANADPEVAGADPLGLCPDRDLGRTVPPTMLSFGDGHHRCPGAPIAIMETEVFVTALLRDGIEVQGPPEVKWNPVTQGYDLDRLMVRRPSRVNVAPCAGWLASAMTLPDSSTKR